MELKATMRAWLLLLAVLATFQAIVQVASTEDITSSFIQAISPQIKATTKHQQQQYKYQQKYFELEISPSEPEVVVTNKQLSAIQTSISPVYDITPLSVTRRKERIVEKRNNTIEERTKAVTLKKSTTVIATILDKNHINSDSVNYSNNNNKHNSNNNNNNNNNNNSYNNNKNNLNISSVKDIAVSKRSVQPVYASDFVVKAQQTQSNKQNKIQNKNKNHNEVNDKSANSAKNALVTVLRTQELQTINSSSNNNNNKVQELIEFNNKKSEDKILTTKSTNKLKTQNSAVKISDELVTVAAEEQEEEEEEGEGAAVSANNVENKSNKMAINESAAPQLHSQRQNRNHNQPQQPQQQQQQQQQQHHQQQHKQNKKNHHHHHHHQQQQQQDTQQHTHQRKHHHHHHHQQQHKNANASSSKTVTVAHLATAERLAIETAKSNAEIIENSVYETPNSVHESAHETPSHLQAAEKLALDSAPITSKVNSTAATSTANATATVDSTTATASDSAIVVAIPDADADDDDDDDDNVDDNDEPATYSNKEIIGDKLKPDPSTLVQIENSLLSLFNMKRPPKIDRSKIIIPEAMKQLYAQIMGHELDIANIRRPSIPSRTANTVRSFTHIESKIDDRFPHHHRFRLYFDVKSIPTEEKLRAAELQLTRDAISERLANRDTYQVLAYDITRVGVRGKRSPSYLLLDNKSVHLNGTDTVHLDVRRALERWLATPRKNHGLLIEVRTGPTLKPAPHHHVRLRRSVDEPHESWQHKQPVLYAYTADGKHKTRSIRDAAASSTRSKRAGHHRRAHRRKNSDEICRRHLLYVDFADVGWSDWIVAPPGYDAFYCQGKCPFPLAEHMNSTNHAVVQTLVNNLNPGKVPKACCVPTQLEGISMLYLNDQNTVVLKNYQDMTVVGCGCR